MRYVLIALIIALTGCTTVPVARKFPDAPEEIKVTCAPLKQTDTTTQLSKVLGTVVENYGSYYECKVKVDAWNEWYATQKKIFDEVK